VKALACFVSSHGYGHATRTSAVLAALRRRHPAIALHVFTEVPESVFADSVPGGVVWHRAWTDVGLVQATPFAEDLAATVRALEQHVPFREAEVGPLARAVRETGAEAVLCDISPLGLAVARAAGLPSILLENFTWDWIYRGYLTREPRLGPLADLLEEELAHVALHLHTGPAPVLHERAHLLGMISRPPRATRAQVRARLGVPAEEKLVLFTLGGISWSLGAGAALPAGVTLLVPAPGQAHDGPAGPVRTLGPSWFHPDLIAAADAVIAKVGYSTLAEVHRAGAPLGFLTRPSFRESPVLERFIRAELPSVELPSGALESGAWADAIPALLALQPRPPAPGRDAAEVAAEQIAATFGRTPG
jgi:hypothetical protein